MKSVKYAVYNLGYTQAIQSKTANISNSNRLHVSTIYGHNQAGTQVSKHTAAFTFEI